MKKKYHLLGVFLFLAPIWLSAQDTTTCNYEIRGTVYDRLTKEPLPYVTVMIENTSTGAATDEQGYFELTGLCRNENDLIFSRLGYKSMVHHHDFHHPDMEIYMVEDHLVLEGITIEAKQNRADLETVQTNRLSGEDFKSVQSELLGDIASQFAGVGAITTGQNISKPVIHGLHSNRILVINNGIRHEFQNWGIEHAPEIDPSLANELEVIKGASTVRFGPDALGGVILVNPAPLELSTPWQGSVQLTGKSNGQSGEGSFNLSKGYKWFSLGASVSALKQGDLHAPDYQLTNTGREELSYSGRFRIHPGHKFDIEGYFSHFDQQVGILSGSVFSNLEDLQRGISSEPPLYTEPFSYDIRAPRQEVQHDLYKLTAKYIGEHQSLSLRYGYQANQRREFGVRRGDAPNIDLELRTHSLDLDWTHPQLGPVTGKMGIQLLQQENDNRPGTNTVPFIPNYEQRRFGVYLIEGYEWGENLLEMGLRFDYMDSYIVGREPDNTIYRNNIFFRNFSGTLGYRRNLGEGKSFRSNFGTAWRAPNVAELYRFGQHAFFLEYGLWRYTIDERFDFVVTTEGIQDEDDRPVPAEVGYKWINTYSWDLPNFRAELTGYINYIENYINSSPGGFTRTPRGVFVYYINDQTDALFWGLDLHAEWTHSSKFTSGFQGSYLWAKQIRRNDYFVEQPPANLRYELSFTPKLRWLNQTELKLSAHYTFEQFQHPRIIPVDEFLNALQLDTDRFRDDAPDFDIVAPPPGYFLADLSWSGTWKSFTFQLEVRNLLNTSYRSYTDRLRYFADGLGRNFIVGLEYSF